MNILGIRSFEPFPAEPGRQELCQLSVARVHVRDIHGETARRLANIASPAPCQPTE